MTTLTGNRADERPAASAIARLVQLSRPRFWLYLAGPVLVGLAYGAGSVDELLSPVVLGLFAYFLVPANVVLYGVNDLFDAPIDRHNPKKEDREGRYEGGPLTPIAVVASLLLALPLAVVLPPASLAWVLAFFALAVAYSAPPLRLKTRPPLDSLSNGLYVLPGVAAYVAVAGVQPPAIGIVGGWLWTMAMHTFSAIPDVDPDRRAGIETLATRLGPRLALGYCVGCWALAAISFGVLDVRAGALLAIYPLLGIAVDRIDISIDRAYWWFPVINAVVGAVLTIAGLWGLVYG